MRRGRAIVTEIVQEYDGIELCNEKEWVSGVSPYIDVEGNNSSLHAQNRHVITRRVDLTDVILARAAYVVDLAIPACRETRKSLPLDKSCCELLPDYAGNSAGWQRKHGRQRYQICQIRNHLVLSWNQNALIVRSRNLLVRRLKANWLTDK